MKLSTLPKGSFCRVVSIECDDAKLKARLLDLGFVSGTQIYVRRRAPLGSPIEYELRGTAVCLRKREAAIIEVEQIDEPNEQ